MRQLIRCLSALALTVFLTVGAAAEEPVPALRGRVNDYSNVLTPAQESQLTAQIEQIETYEGHPQVVILTVPTIGDESIEDYSIRVADTWGIGQRDLDNGVLITILTDVEDFQVRLEIGSGLEGAIPDVTARAIYNERMRPHFREEFAGHEDYTTALTDGITALAALIRGEATGYPAIDNAEEIAAHQGLLATVLLIGGIITLIGSFMHWTAGGSLGAVTGVVFALTLPGSFFVILVLAVVGFVIGVILGPVVQAIGESKGMYSSSGGWGSGSGGGGFSGGGGGFSGGGFSGGR